MHVRKASTYLKDKLIDADHAHPFESENFIFAHNGTLEFKDVDREKEERFNKMIDSQMFLSILEEEYTKKNNLEEALNSAMSNFYGKFAFLIKVKPTGEFFAVRGNTATLFYANIEILNSKNEVVTSGYVINTERTDLEKNIAIFNNYLLYLKNMHVDVKKTIDGISHISDNTIAKLDENDCSFGGKIVENKKVYPVVVLDNNNGRDRDYNWRSRWSNNYDVTNGKYRYYVDKINEIMENWSVTIQYLDWVFLVTVGKTFLTADKDEYILFFSIADALTEKYLSPEKRGLIHSIWKRCIQGSTERNVYAMNPNLPLPYFMDRTELKNAANIMVEKRIHK